MGKVQSLILMLLLFTGFLQGETFAKKNGSQEAMYKLIDLGECDISLDELLHKDAVLSLVPRINQNGLVIGNRKSGGFIWRHGDEKFIAYSTDREVQFHAVNENGDVLVSTKGSGDTLDWAVWSTGAGAGEKREPIFKGQSKVKSICFCDLDNKKVASGYFINDDEKKQMVLSTSEKGSVYPADENAKHLLGVYQGMNQKGIAYGFILENEIAKPAVWSLGGSLTKLKNYREKIVPEGDIVLESLAMTDEGVAYGTYWIKYPKVDPIVSDLPKNYHNFAWQPSTGAFKLIDIDGMLVDKVNGIHTLAGTLNGKPAICEAAKKPIELSRLIHPNQLKEWEIIQISDINNDNHLVGIGKYQGTIHIFFAERTR